MANENIKTALVKSKPEIMCTSHPFRLEQLFTPLVRQEPYQFANL
jgi:hypothetical protein